MISQPALLIECLVDAFSRYIAAAPSSGTAAVSAAHTTANFGGRRVS